MSEFTKGEGGGHKIGKMGRLRLWMTPYITYVQTIINFDTNQSRFTSFSNSHHNQGISDKILWSFFFYLLQLQHFVVKPLSIVKKKSTCLHQAVVFYDWKNPEKIEKKKKRKSLLPGLPKRIKKREFANVEFANSENLQALNVPHGIQYTEPKTSI